MAEVTSRWARRPLAWLRGVRGRLVATYLLAATIVAVGGLLLFTISLEHGLRANIDAGLHARADALAADVRDGNIEHSDPGPTIGRPARGGEDVTTFTAVIDPNGTLIDAQPKRLPASPAVSTRPSSTTLTSVGFGGAPFRILTIPVQRSDGRWLVVVGQSLEPANEANAQVRRDLIAALPVLLALVGCGAWLLSGSALKPVDRMRADAQRLSENAGEGRLTEPDTRDSLNRLARTFNKLLDRLHDSLERQRDLVADAGHELRTPLAVLKAELETAVRPMRTRDDLVESIAHAQLEVDRLAALANDLLLLAQTDSAHRLVATELTDVTTVIDDVIAGHREQASSRAVSLHVSSPPALVADVDPAAIRRILDNLVTNALRHAPENGHVWIEAQRHGANADEAPALVIRVRDNGPGFPGDFLSHAFDRFSRADQGRSRATSATSSGLGLAIVQSLVLAHHGTVTAANAHDGGAVVEARIPADAE